MLHVSQVCTYAARRPKFVVAHPHPTRRACGRHGSKLTRSSAPSDTERRRGVGQTGLTNAAARAGVCHVICVVLGPAGGSRSRRQRGPSTVRASVYDSDSARDPARKGLAGTGLGDGNRHSRSMGRTACACMCSATHGRGHGSRRAARDVLGAA